MKTITLSRPEKRNALNPELIAMITDAFSGNEPVLLRAEGPAFCAGLDLDHLWAMMQRSYEENLEDARRLGAMYYRIWNYPHPVTAAVQGPALAGGCGLVSVCDYVVAKPAATFGYTEAAIGFLPAIVSIFLDRGRDVLLSGRIIDAKEALQIGFIDEVSEELEVRTAGKRPRKQITPEELDAACIANAKARFTPEARAGVRTFLERRKK